MVPPYDSLNMGTEIRKGALLDHGTAAVFDPYRRAAVDEYMQQVVQRLGVKFFADFKAIALSRATRPPGHIFDSESLLYGFDSERFLPIYGDLCPFRGSREDAHPIYLVLVHIGVEAETPQELSVLQQIAIGNMVQPKERDLKLMIEFLYARGYHIELLGIGQGRIAGFDAERRHSAPYIEEMQVLEDTELLLSLMHQEKYGPVANGQGFYPL